MSMKVRIVLAIFLFGMVSIVGGANVTVLMFETGVPENAAKIEATSAWESGLMAAFFDSGYIVSNAETRRLEKIGLPSSSLGLAEAREGGADFIIGVSLDYGSVSQGKRIRIAPRSVSYRICDNNGDSLFEDRKNDLAPTKSGDEDEKNAAELSRVLIAQLKKGR